MNLLVIIALGAGLAAIAAVAWAVKERVRAATAEAEVRALQGSAELAQAQAARSAESVAEAILKRNDEVERAREQLVQAKLEAQLTPVAAPLAEYQEPLAAVEKSRA